MVEKRREDRQRKYDTEMRDVTNGQIERKEDLAFVLGLGCQVEYEGMHSNSPSDATENRT